MQFLEKSGLLIKNHRVNKSLDPEEFYLLFRRALIFMPAHTHHHSSGSSVNLLLVVFSPGPRATLLWDALPISPKGKGVLSWLFIQLCIFKSLQIEQCNQKATSLRKYGLQAWFSSQKTRWLWPAPSLKASTFLICEIRNHLYSCCPKFLPFPITSCIDPHRWKVFRISF